jgi:mediator of RNA polymerase II transcription subunit 7
MADLEDKGTFSEHYPAPPPFWRMFTEANIASIKDIRESGEEVPEELRALVPPPVPTDGKYRSFGANWNVC